MSVELDPAAISADVAEYIADLPGFVSDEPIEPIAVYASAVSESAMRQVTAVMVAPQEATIQAPADIDIEAPTATERTPLSFTLLGLLVAAFIPANWQAFKGMVGFPAFFLLCTGLADLIGFTVGPTMWHNMLLFGAVSAVLVNLIERGLFDERRAAEETALHTWHGNDYSGYGDQGASSSCTASRQANSTGRG